MIDEVLTLTEPERGCGYRSPGAGGVGIYLMGGNVGTPCKRLPWELTVCPTCSCGIKPARGWTTIQPKRLLVNPDLTQRCRTLCPVCTPPTGNHGLIWIGEKYYSPKSFLKEAQRLGVSRKLAAVPNDLVIGETWVYLAHREAVIKPAEFGAEPDITPGIFSVFKPTHIDLVIDDPENIPDRAIHIKERLGDDARLVKIKKQENNTEVML